jgi:enoyl-CoA hydratase
MSEVSIEKQGRIAIVRFDRGNRANAFSRSLMAELTEVAHTLEDDTTLSAVVLTGQASVFSMGVDLKEAAASMVTEDAGLGRRLMALKAGPRLCAAWEAIDALTIAAVEGWCIGGGAALAMACDLRVIGRSGQFYVPEIERGMNMSWGSVPRFVALCGPAKTKRIVSLAEKVDADRALAWGLADEVSDDGRAVEKALEFAQRAAELPPVALRMTKQDVNAAAHALAGVTAYRDREAFALSQTSDDFGEGVTAFLEGRKPTFTGK